MMISDMLSKHVGAVESVLKKWFKINDIQLVHLLVVWYLVTHKQNFIADHDVDTSWHKEESKVNAWT